MSSCPGCKLEYFLIWELNVLVENEPDCNKSLQMHASIFGMDNRSVVSQKTFRSIVSLFEEYRETVEHRLIDFDDENQSWRDYAGSAFEFIPDELFEQANKIINQNKLANKE